VEEVEVEAEPAVVDSGTSNMGSNILCRMSFSSSFRIFSMSSSTLFFTSIGVELLRDAMSEWIELRRVWGWTLVCNPVVGEVEVREDWRITPHSSRIWRKHGRVKSTFDTRLEGVGLDVLEGGAVTKHGQGVLETIYVGGKNFLVC